MPQFLISSEQTDDDSLANRLRKNLATLDSNATTWRSGGELAVKYSTAKNLDSVRNFWLASQIQLAPAITAVVWLRDLEVAIVLCKAQTMDKSAVLVKDKLALARRMVMQGVLPTWLGVADSVVTQNNRLFCILWPEGDLFQRPNDPMLCMLIAFVTSLSQRSILSATMIKQRLQPFYPSDAAGRPLPVESVIQMAPQLRSRSSVLGRIFRSFNAGGSR